MMDFNKYKMLNFNIISGIIFEYAGGSHLSKELIEDGLAHDWFYVGNEDRCVVTFDDEIQMGACETYLNNLKVDWCYYLDY